MNGSAPPTDAWYTEEGPDNDVVLSTRIRFARNLESFAFPIALKADEAENVLSVVFDVVNNLQNSDQYQLIQLSNVDTLGRRILSERGIINTEIGAEYWKGVIIRNDSILSMTVNIEDHIRFAAVSAGLAVPFCIRTALDFENELQKNLQFSSAEGFGYLTSALSGVGSGMKTSVFLSLQGLHISGFIDRVIREYLAQGFIIHGYYGEKQDESLGSLYQFCNSSCASGDIDSQLAEIEEAIKKIVALERESRNELLAVKPTILEDISYRAIVTAKYARFLSLQESIELLQDIKLGLSLGLITGVTHSALTALLFRIRNGHISFVIQNKSIMLEEDIQTDELRMNRLRAMVIQEVLKNADICERRK
ncbi:hypothetical protein K7I13_00910 [Brucepastera parasyntrophica]|uniref:hypothetical protein n=1 Tax=Brucepastera parasyntrophica TaxID=2880008 RepID=UPI002109D1FB|nr:hypothetical protein [Brucepastera parasyntrophica]ULQ59939.1 hypothetical protein K7I13_00910 [Brucepastera parasyntrophica]